jgi:hypothetical protein
MMDLKSVRRAFDNSILRSTSCLEALEYEKKKGLNIADFFFGGNLISVRDI